MKSTVTRRIALALSVVSSLALVSAAPAGAAEAPTCQTLLHTTPGIDVDLNDDGYPEYRAPRIHDVELCSDTGAGYVVHTPAIDNCSDVPRSVECMAVRIRVAPVTAGAYATATLCFTIEGFGPSCNTLVDVSTGGDWIQPRVICVGYDLDGGHPCGGSMFALE